VADLRISELPDGTTAQATDVIPIVRAGENYRLALSALSPAADTQVLFKDGTLVAGSSDFVFDKTLKALASGTDAVTALGKSTKRWATAYFGGVAAVVPLVVKAHASQTAALQEWQNSGGTALAAVDKDGGAGFKLGVHLGQMTSVPWIFPFSGSSYTSPSATGTNIAMYVGSSAVAGNISYGFNADANTAISGINYGYSFVGSFAPTSGAGDFSGFAVRTTVNQTGGASGVTRALYLLPVITAGADARGLEILAVGAGAPAFRPLIIRAASGQTANLSEWQDNGAAVLAAVTKDGYLRVGANQVVSARKTGWGAPTGTPTRTAFDTSTVTLPQLAERLKALIDDLTSHGLVGA